MMNGIIFARVNSSRAVNEWSVRLIQMKNSWVWEHSFYCRTNSH